MEERCRVLLFGGAKARSAFLGASGSGGVELLHAASLSEAVRVMEGEALDAALVELGRERPEGPELLRALRAERPAVARIGYVVGPREWIDRSVLELVQRAVVDDGGGGALVDAVLRSCAVQALMANRAVQEAAGRLDHLPSTLRGYLHLLDVLSAPRSTTQAVIEVVEHDPAVAAKILQLTNSAFFGAGRRLASITEAVSLLGFDMIKALALSTHVFGLFEHLPAPSFSLERHQAYAFRVARLARDAVPEPLGSYTFSAALLMDVGTLVLAATMPDVFEEVHHRAIHERIAPELLERELLGVTHAEVGAYLLGLWGLPGPIVEAVAFHHAPSSLGSRRDCAVLASVHAHDALLGIAACGDPPDRLDEGFLAAAGYASALPRWRSTVLAHVHSL